MNDILGSCSEVKSGVFGIGVNKSATPERVKRGLMGANLPFVIQPTYDSMEVEVEKSNIEIQTILSQIDDGVDDS